MLFILVIFFLLFVVIRARNKTTAENTCSERVMWRSSILVALIALVILVPVILLVPLLVIFLILTLLVFLLILILILLIFFLVLISLISLILLLLLIPILLIFFLVLIFLISLIPLLILILILLIILILATFERIERSDIHLIQPIVTERAHEALDALLRDTGFVLTGVPILVLWLHEEKCCVSQRSS